MIAAHSSSFDDLQFAFSVAGKTLLQPEEERRLAMSIWESRRRIARTLDGRKPSVTRTHPKPLSPRLKKKLLAAEKEARTVLKSPRVSSSLGLELSRELSLIEEARGSLLRHNLRLVAWIAKRFERKGMELADLFQEGAIALLWSIDRFDPWRGTRLSTFASHAIQLGIIRALADKGRAVRVPSYRLPEVIAASSARAHLLERTGREPAAEDIEAESGVPRESLEELLPALRPMASLDAPLAGDDRPFSYRVADTNALSPFDRAARSEARELAHLALARLSERDRRIVSMRFGLDEGDESSYEAIGRSMGLSRERTRQLETSARAKLRALLSRRNPASDGSSRPSSPSIRRNQRP
jgi:RNA polymerase sigma factor (sigma-70 family)